MRIIQATLEHLDVLTPMFIRYRELYGAMPLVEQSRAFLEQCLSTQQAVTFLAFDEATDKLMGFNLLYLSHSSLSLRPVWILNDIFVCEDSRRKQVARHLVIRAKEEAIKNNAVRIRVATNSANETTRKMYESLGFYENHQLTNYILALE